MNWFRKPCHRRATHDELDDRIAEAEAQRDEAAEAKKVSQARAERIRERVSQNKLGEGFIAAFRSWEGQQ